MTGPTLTEALAAAGFTHRRAATYATTGSHDILDASGAVVFTGAAHHTWEWLHSLPTGAHQSAPSHQPPPSDSPSPRVGAFGRTAELPLDARPVLDFLVLLLPLAFGGLLWAATGGAL